MATRTADVDAGGNGVVNVSRGASCTWTATWLPSWITLTSGASGSGPGSVSYTVAPNTGEARMVNLNIAGYLHHVSQAAGAIVPLAHSNAWFASYQQDGTAWIVVEVLGVAVGGALSAIAAGRFKVEVVRGPATGRTARLWTAAAGGMLVGVGAVLAGGCTSGQALSGGAMLSVGSWAFMIAVFAAGYGAMPFFRRLWT